MWQLFHTILTRFSPAACFNQDVTFISALVLSSYVRRGRVVGAHSVRLSGNRMNGRAALQVHLNLRSG